MYWFFPEKNAPVYLFYVLGTFKNQVCHLWWALQYLALWVTNRNIQSVYPDAEWECPSASINKHNTPAPTSVSVVQRKRIRLRCQKSRVQFRSLTRIFMFLFGVAVFLLLGQNRYWACNSFYNIISFSELNILHNWDKI